MTETEEQDIIDLFSVLNYDVIDMKGALRNPTIVLEQLEKVKDTYATERLYAFQCELVDMGRGALSLSETETEFHLPSHNHANRDILVEQVHLEIQLLAAAINVFSTSANNLTNKQCDALLSLTSRHRSLRDQFQMLVETVA